LSGIDTSEKHEPAPARPLHFGSALNPSCDTALIGVIPALDQETQRFRSHAGVLSAREKRFLSTCYARENGPDLMLVADWLSLD